MTEPHKLPKKRDLSALAMALLLAAFVTPVLIAMGELVLETERLLVALDAAMEASYGD